MVTSIDVFLGRSSWAVTYTDRSMLTWKVRASIPAYNLGFQSIISIRRRQVVRMGSSASYKSGDTS